MAETGHRTLPHPADVILQEWAPTPQDCIAEAVLALVEAFAEHFPADLRTVLQPGRPR